MTAWIDSLDFPEPWIDLRGRRDRVARRRLVARYRKELRRRSHLATFSKVAHGTIIGLGVPARTMLSFALTTPLSRWCI